MLSTRNKFENKLEEKTVELRPVWLENNNSEGRTNFFDQEKAGAIYGLFTIKKKVSGGDYCSGAIK